MGGGSVDFEPSQRGGSMPFSIVLVKLVFNATRNSRKEPKIC